MRTIAMRAFRKTDPLPSRRVASALSRFITSLRALRMQSVSFRLGQQRSLPDWHATRLNDVD